MAVTQSLYSVAAKPVFMNFAVHLQGKSHGKSGYFPATYVIPLQPDQRVFQVLQPLNLSDGTYSIKFHKEQVRQMTAMHEIPSVTREFKDILRFLVQFSGQRVILNFQIITKLKTTITQVECYNDNVHGVVMPSSNILDHTVQC